MNCHSSCVLLCFVLCSSGAAQVVVPPDLNPGDQYRLVFVTDEPTFANSADINDYNQFVDTAANASSAATSVLGINWVAIASTDVVDARDNTNTNPNVSAGIPVYRLDGVRIADDYADLWDGTIQNPLFVTETLTTIGNSGVWTGSNVNGTGDPTHSLDGTGPFVVGESLFTQNNWILGGLSPSTSERLYAINAVPLTVPEPSAFLVLILTSTLFGGRRWAARRKSSRLE